MQLASENGELQDETGFRKRVIVNCTGHMSFRWCQRRSEQLKPSSADPKPAPQRPHRLPLTSYGLRHEPLEPLEPLGRLLLDLVAVIASERELLAVVLV